MSEVPCFGRRWRELKIAALEQQLSELYMDPTRPWDRYSIVPYEITRFERYLKVHPAVVRHVGRTRQEILGDQGWEDYIHPDDRSRVGLVWKRYCLQGSPVEGLELRYRHGNSGLYVYLEDYVFPISWDAVGRPVRFSAWFENITERKHAEIEFLLACLRECDRPTSREPLRKAIRRAVAESRNASTRLRLLEPTGPGRARRH